MSAGEAREPARPVTTYCDASARYSGTSQAIERFKELDHRHHLVRAYQNLRALGEYDTAKHGPDGKYKPLTMADRLELIAAGEMVARCYRHPAHVDDALTAGATWTQIAEATGSDETHARQAYRECADSQHRLWQHHGGKFGMSDAEYAAAMRRLSGPGTEAGQ